MTTESKSSLRANFSGFYPECGCDEAGRGCLAGPVVAAAVILPPDFHCAGLNDSKKLTEKKRDELRPIIEREAISWAVACVEADEIDKINILNASILAMHRAIALLQVQPSFIIVDGNRFKSYNDTPHQTIVKGDGKFLSIAAASVLAKTHRDALMETLSSDFPVYNWGKNKAYPTPEHREAINKFGVSPHHRTTFRLLKDPELPLSFIK